MKRIVVTGGPCSGKTEALALAREALAEAGVRALFVPEAATDLILEGIAPWTLGSMKAFQVRVAQLELEREDAAAIAAAEQGIDLVIYDRGLCDGAAYLPEEEYREALDEVAIDHETALARYDAVFCLESLASFDSSAYSCDNNAARTESAEEAAVVDRRIRAAWEKHPRFTFVPCTADFDAKVRALCRGIAELATRSS